MSGEGRFSGTEKAAVLLINVGEELASEMLKHLSPREVQIISENLARMESVPATAGRDVVREFFEVMDRTDIAVKGMDFVKKTILKALGPDKGKKIIEHIAKEMGGDGINAISYMEPSVIANIIKGEHPQIIALMLTLIDPDRASEVLNCLPERLRGDVIQRVATTSHIPQAAVQEIEEVMKEQMIDALSPQGNTVEGVKVAAEILNHTESSVESVVMEFIEKNNPELAAMIQEKMFVFTDILSIDDRGMQQLLKELDNETLALALKGADEEMRSKFFRNMSERAAEMLKEDIETRGPVKVSDVEKAQIEIVKVAKRLEDEGTIVIGGKKGDVIM